MIRKNDKAEQLLINEFADYMSKKHSSIIFINKDSKSKTCADLEYILDDVLWVILAKSHKSKDAYNSAHKLFGELLKETGRSRTSDGRHEFERIKYALLIPGDTYPYTTKSGIDFYKRHFMQIDRKKYLEFGELIPINDIYIYHIGNKELIHMTWGDFIGLCPGILIFPGTII